MAKNQQLRKFRGENLFGDVDGGNYVHLDRYGRVRREGPNSSIITDVNMPLTQSKSGSTDKPDFDYTNVGYLFPSNDVSYTEVLSGILQLPHSYKEGSDLVPHVHWRQASANSPLFRLQYQWYNNNDTYPGTWTTLWGTSNVFTYPGSGNFAQIQRFAAIDGTGMYISSILKVKLSRANTSDFGTNQPGGWTDVAGDVLTDSFDFHIEMDTDGSINAWQKP